MGELIREDKRHASQFLSPLPPIPVGSLVFWFCPMAICLPYFGQHIRGIPPVDLSLEEQLITVLCFWDQLNFVHLGGMSPKRCLGTIGCMHQIG